MNPPSLILGAYMQPPANFGRWRDRGINTIITDRSKPDPAPGQPESPAARRDYFRAAADAGLRVIIGPDAAGPANDLAAPGFLGWSQADEPENWSHVKRAPDGSFDWDATIAAYIARYVMLKSISPATSICGNFNGDPVGSARETDANPKNVTLPHYRRFAAGADWLSCDRYVRARGRSAEEYKFLGGHQDRLALIKPGAPHFSVLETCLQGLPADKPPAPTAHPTPDEVRAEVWMTLIHGATGLIFFPLKIGGGFSFDNTPPDVAAALPGILGEVKKFERLLLGGQRVKNPAAEEASWSLSDGSHLKASMAWDVAAGRWNLSVVGAVVAPPVDPELERLRKDNVDLRIRIRHIEEWHGRFPQ